MNDKSLYEKNLDERIFNLDEVGLYTDQRTTKVFVPLSSHGKYLKTPNSGKTMYSVLFCASACGSYLKPFIMYKRKNLYNTWTNGGSPKAAYGCTKSG